MTHHSQRLRRVGAGAAMGALVASTLLVTSPAQAAEKVLSEPDVNLNYTRAAGSNTFLPDGVLVETVGDTSQSKAAGYFATDIALAAAGEPSLDWSGTAARPGTQLLVDFDGDPATTGDRGTLVGEAVYNGSWWLPGKTLDEVPVDPAIIAAAPKNGGGGSPENGPLSAWRQAFPNAKVIGAGWSMGSGVAGKGTIFRITVGSTDFGFTAAPVTTTTLHRNDVSKRDTGLLGHNTFRSNGGVRIQTDPFVPATSSQAKATGYFAVNQPLARIGEMTWDYRVSTGIEPGKQLIIDLDGNPATTNDRGTLVGEPVYGKVWWLTNGSSAAVKAVAPFKDRGGFGSPNNGTLNEWRRAAPNATVLEAGWSLGSGVTADGVLSSVTLGQTVFDFAGNRAPSAAPVSGALREGDAAIEIPLLGTDPDTQAYTGAIADTLTYTVSGADGDATISGNKLVYRNDDVAADFSDGFTYTVTDDRGLSATADVTVAVTANKAPVAGDLTASTRTDDAKAITLAATDPEGDAITYSITQPTSGEASLSGSTVTYTPDEGFAGPDAFTYTATDSRGAATTADVSVTVNANGAPVIADVTRSTRTGDAVVIDLSATDPEGDAVTFTVADPAHGTAVVGAGDKVTYTPDPGYSGTDTFAYTATDDRGATSTKNIAVTVAANRAPVVTNVSGSTKAGAAVTLTLPATDPEGDAITYTASAPTPGTGTVTVAGNQLTFTPASGFAGSSAIAFTATDSRGAATSGTVAVTVARLVSAVDIYKVSPASGKITTGSKVSVSATVSIDGQRAPRGTVVDVYAKGKKVGTGVVNGQGKVKASLRNKLPKGKATIKVELPASATIVGSSDSISVTVRKK